MRKYSYNDLYRRNNDVNIRIMTYIVVIMP